MNPNLQLVRTTADCEVLRPQWLQNSASSGIPFLQCMHILSGDSETKPYPLAVLMDDACDSIILMLRLENLPTEDSQ
jgi:hypothetical protein